MDGEERFRAAWAAQQSEKPKERPEQTHVECLSWDGFCAFDNTVS